ncbi:MAG: geranylgeranyl reductase family protein [Oscillatoriales cyanobacterium]|nr:MAG: geranylgeranyl reductase family protein [Oscillatoriales cyanobacterium]
MMTETFDCVIFGAGPAGASAAYGLARAGYRVIAIAGHCHRATGCTGGVSPGVARLLDFDLTSVIDHTVRDVRYTWNNGDPVTIQLDSAQAMWMVQRDRLDALLREQAQQAGAVMYPATATGAALSHGSGEPVWTVQTDAASLTARYAIVADGACSEATHWIGGQRPVLRWAAMLEVETPSLTPNEPPLVEFGLGQIDNGLLWCFPKRTTVSIGAASFLGKDDPQLMDRLLSYTRSRGWHAQHADIRQRPIALWSGERPLHTDRAVIVGDAAGLADPVTAEGIRPAIDSGLRAAEAIAAALSTPASAATALATYTQTIQQTWGADFTWASRLSQILYRVPGLAYKVAIKKPIANQLMAQVLSGDLRYSDMAGKAIAKLSKKLLPW